MHKVRLCVLEGAGSSQHYIYTCKTEANSQLVTAYPAPAGTKAARTDCVGESHTSTTRRRPDGNRLGCTCSIWTASPFGSLHQRVACQSCGIISTNVSCHSVILWWLERVCAEGGSIKCSTRDVKDRYRWKLSEEGSAIWKLKYKKMFFFNKHAPVIETTVKHRD